MRSILFVIFLSFTFAQTIGQILDDSTKQIYSAKTTFIFQEADIIDGDIDELNPDTTINFIHQYNWQTRNNNFYQDLGNLGSALYPVFYTPTRSIGVNYGVRIYDDYFEDPDEMRYFNTRSPFTQLKYIQGANNYGHLTAEFARNVNPYLNFSFKVDRFTSDKSLGNIGRDRLVEHANFSFATNYRSKNGRYLALYHYSNLTHEVEEQGGIRPLPGDRIPEDLFLYQAADVWLNNAFTWERRNNHHIYQHFKILRDSTSDFRIYHEFDRVNIKDRYRDDDILESAEFYNNTFYESIENTFHTIQYNLYENKIGIGGSLNRGLKYRAYTRHRYFYSNLTNDYNTEIFVGGMIRKRVNTRLDSIDIIINGESQLPGDYRIGIEIRGKKINLEAYRALYSPDIIQDRFKSNHLVWNNSFDRSLSDNLMASFKQKFGKHYILPFINLHRISNFIYYDENALPAQVNAPIFLSYVGLESHFQFWKIHLRSRFQYSQSDGPDVIRFPEFYAKAVLYFETRISQNKSTLQVGFDGFYRSSFYGNAYMPVSFQYHLQDDFLMNSAVVPDVFASFQFRQAQAFIKVPYFTQGWAVPGYFSSPYYTGVPRPDAIALGFRWQFYD